ncbi:MAG: diphthine synthase [Candidatus Woesearchaeota archaeon]|nr:MAG: diphthine synthase [Candidatus Woesearchaeota archaeon]
MLYLIGLGLSWKDISLKALEVINKCDKIYLETYTSVSNFSSKKLSKLLGKKVIELNRKQVEEEKPFLKESKIKDVALLIYGDPLMATTHQEFKAEVVHGPSVFDAVGETGLSPYKFGKIASIPIPEKNFKPESFFKILEDNKKIDAHTLFLLDLKPNKFLTIPEAIKILLEISKKRKSKSFTNDTLCVGCARLGHSDSFIKKGKAKDLIKKKFGNPPYCLIIPAKLSFKEEEFLSKY